MELFRCESLFELVLVDGDPWSWWLLVRHYCGLSDQYLWHLPVDEAVIGNEPIPG